LAWETAELRGPVPGQRVLTLVAVILIWSAQAAAKDLAVISNKSNTVQAMTLADLAKVCKGQSNRWPDGKAVVFITRSPALPEMHLLLDKIYGMPKDDVMALIANANRRNDHPAIMIVDTDEALVKKVESTPGAVGLVDVYSISGGVTVVKIAGKLPLEPGYPLHGN
jgi:hypothetical protein